MIRQVLICWIGLQLIASNFPPLTRLIQEV